MQFKDGSLIVFHLCFFSIFYSGPLLWQHEGTLRSVCIFCLRSQGRIIGSSIIFVDFTWKSKSQTVRTPPPPPPIDQNRLGPAPSFPGIFATQVEKERHSLRSFGGSKFTAKFETSGNSHGNFYDMSKWSQKISRFSCKLTCFHSNE